MAGSRILASFSLMYRYCGVQELQKEALMTFRKRRIESKKSTEEAKKDTGKRCKAACEGSCLLMGQEAQVVGGITAPLHL